MTQHQSQLFVFVFFFLLLDRARCLQRTEICAHGALTIHQNSPWYSSYYTEKNSKWLWVIFSSGRLRMCVCDDIWKVPGKPTDDKLELFQREEQCQCVKNGTTFISWQPGGEKHWVKAVICLHLSLRLVVLTGPFTQPQCIWIKWWMLFIKPYLI